MTHDTDEENRQSVRFEHNGAIFELETLPVSKNRRTGRFVAIIDREGGGYTGWVTADFDTEEDAIAAGKALIVAKTAEYQTIRGKLKGTLEFIAAWICLVPVAILLVIVVSMNAVEKRWRGRA
jgi:hypothetical protein